MLKFVKRIFGDLTNSWEKRIQDSVLGELRLTEDGSYWEAATLVSGALIQFRISGDAKPSTQSLKSAHEIVISFPAFQQRLFDFLRSEASQQTSWSGEILRLNVKSINFLWTDRPFNAEVHLSESGEPRFWVCEYEGDFKNLGFDR